MGKGTGRASFLPRPFPATHDAPPWGVTSVPVLSPGRALPRVPGPASVPTRSHRLSCSVVVSKCYNKENSGLMSAAAFKECKSLKIN